MKRPESFVHGLSVAIIAAGFAIPLLSPPPLQARVLSGSVTERKINRKITSMLKSARKSYDSGKVQQALDSYWKILELDPMKPLPILNLVKSM
jgi:hypothetical protein